MKLLARTIKGKEFYHRTEGCYFTSDRQAEAIRTALNQFNIGISEMGENWYIYDHDFSQNFYTKHKILIGDNRNIKIELC
jgi:hypothetical protein